MLEKITVLSIFYIAILAYDVPKLKNNKLPERISYWMLMLVSIYLGLNYVLEMNLPNLTNLVNGLLAKPGKHIFDMLHVP